MNPIHNQTAESDRNLVVFDLDDTLLDTSRGLRVACEHVSSRLGRAFSDGALLELLRYFDPRSAIELALSSVDEADGRDELDFDKALATFLDLEVEHSIPLVDPAVLCAVLDSASLSCAVVTNGDPTQQRRKFVHSGLAEVLPKDALLVCDGEALPFKPNPEALKKVILDNRAAHTLVVGDRRTDVMIGRLLGCKTVQIKSPRSILGLEGSANDYFGEADVVFDRMGVDVLHYVKSLAWTCERD